jgi:hypothetical protein
MDDRTIAAMLKRLRLLQLKSIQLAVEQEEVEGQINQAVTQYGEKPIGKEVASR